MGRPNSFNTCINSMKYELYVTTDYAYQQLRASVQAHWNDRCFTVFFERAAQALIQLETSHV